MIDRILFTGTKLRVLKRALDVYADRGRVHARNVANAETPGYRPQEVRFEDDLRLALRTAGESRPATTNERHLALGGTIPAGTPAVRTPVSPLAAGAVNDVEVDREMADIAQNTMRYTVAAEFVSRAYEAMKKAIHGRPMA